MYRCNRNLCSIFNEYYAFRNEKLHYVWRVIYMDLARIYRVKAYLNISEMQRNSVNNRVDSDKLPEMCLLCDELRDTFYSSNKKGNVFQVRLNSDGLLLQRGMSNGKYKDNFIKIGDIVGSRCVWIQKSKRFGTTDTCSACSPNIKKKRDEDAYLYVFAYILKKNIRSALRRERTVVTLRFRSFDSHEDNMREAEKWDKVLKIHRSNYLSLFSLQRSGSKEQVTLSETRRLLILLNPKSGSGKARQLFHQQVAPVLNEAGISYDLHVTKHCQYAYNFVRHKNLSVWSAIVAIGGDGIFHDILNGILKRGDWERIVTNVAFGIVPCGSGNGLARSIAHYFHEPYEPKPILGAALTVVGGHSTTMDIVEIELQNKVIYSFLSVGWGLISDIDIESERLRPLGYQRFTIWTIHRLINLRTYRGRISYLPKECGSEVWSTKNNITRISLQDTISCNTFHQVSELRKEADINNSEFEDVLSLETVANHSFHSRRNSLLSSGSRKSSYYSIAESIYHSVSGNSDCNETYKRMDNNEEYPFRRFRQLETNSFPSLIEPIPDTWFVEDGEFVMIHAVYQTHLGSDCYFSPQSKLNDGTIYLVIIRGGISRSQLFNFLISMSSGSHLPTKNTDFIRVERVVAFRLEPYENSGILTVDGERTECGSLQARIFPRTINVMVPKKDSCTDC